uniref:Kelch-like protein 10 n=1 Tax=Echeneis naucrates TaxID=173247 RepID=A0A665VN07_ECHNA
MRELGQFSASTFSLDSQRNKMKESMSDMMTAVLTEFVQEEKLCDVVIKVDDTEFNAHKIILCSCSRYFYTLFTGAWTTSGRQAYTIPGLSPEMMRLIINYAYTRSVSVTESNVVEVLAAADQLLVPGIVQACCLFLEDQLSLTNSIGIWRLVNFYNCPELKHKVFLYILYHFEEIVCVSQEFLELSLQELGLIIENDHLNMKQENVVFDTVIQWISHQPDQRQNHISELLSKMRLGLMTPKYLHGVVMGHSLVTSRTECQRIVDKAISACARFRASRCSKSVFRNPLSRPRLPADILFVTGGRNPHSATANFEAYDVRTDRWVTVNAEISRTHHGAAVLDNFVYLIGGCDHETYLKTVERFDITTFTWQQVAPMNSRRCYVSVAVENGYIYAMGGSGGHTNYNSVECYTPETNLWTPVAPMTRKRCGAGATSLNGKVLNDQLFVVGGHNSFTLTSVECYNADTSMWQSACSIEKYHNDLSCCVLRGFHSLAEKLFSRGLPVAPQVEKTQC